MSTYASLFCSVFDSLFAFNKAVQEKSFAQFHEERLSPMFRKQFPLDKFTATFQPFIDKGYDISNIAKFEPVFDIPPAIDSDVSDRCIRSRNACPPNRNTNRTA